MHGRLQATDEVDRLQKPKILADHGSDPADVIPCSVDGTELGIAKERLQYHEAVKSGLMGE